MAGNGTHYLRVFKGKEAKDKLPSAAISRQREVVTPAIKAAGNDPIQDPTTVGGNNQVNAKLVLEPGTSQTGTLIDRF